MNKLKNSNVRQWTFGVLLVFFCVRAIPAATHPSAGLWGGENSLDSADQAGTTGYQVKNAPAPQAERTTPTADTAHVRLLLHVDSDGKVNLLKNVTVINKAPAGLPADLVLLTDDALLSAFKGPSRRFSAAAFDFGDKNAHDYVETTSRLLATKIRDDAAAEPLSPPINGAVFNTSVANVKAKVPQRVTQALSDPQVAALLPAGELPENFQKLKTGLQSALLLAGSRAVEDVLGARRAALEAA